MTLNTNLLVKHALMGRAWIIEDKTTDMEIATIYYSFKEDKEMGRKQAELFAAAPDLLDGYPEIRVGLTHAWYHRNPENNVGRG